MMQPQGPIWTAVAYTSTAIVLLTVVFVVHQLCLHPLARVPGPRYAALSNIWQAWYARNGLMLQLSKSVHRQYGPAVRVGPNEVWFDSKEAFLEIYNATSGFKKSSFYVALALHRPQLTASLGLRFPDTLDLLGEFDMQRYRFQRRLIGPLYQKRSLLKYQDTLSTVLMKAIAQLESLNGAEVDLKEWMHMITVECLTAIVLSWSPGFLQARTDRGTGSHAYLGWRRKSVFGLFPWAEVADAYSRTLGRAFAKLWGLTFRPPATFKALFPLLANKTSRRIASSLRPLPAKDNRCDLAAELIQLHKGRPEFTADYLKRMIMTNFGAGHETTTATLTAALSLIGTHSHVQKRVSAELEGINKSEYLISDAGSADFRYTRAAIKESQRLYPVIGMSLSRTVPSPGLHLHGHYFPPGTTVGCNPYSLHRNAEIVGSEPEQFVPERWLDSDRAREMERCNLIWGGGARSCPGRNLAELIVYYVVPTLVREFEIEVSMPAEDEFRFYFMAMLTGVKARFRRRRAQV